MCSLLWRLFWLFLAVKAKKRYFLLNGGVEGLLVAAIGLKNPGLTNGMKFLTHRFLPTIQIDKLIVILLGLIMPVYCTSI